jgi:hypothetical protein
MVKKQNQIWNFLKPTIAKLVIFLIIIVVFVPVVRIDTGVRCITEPCDSASNVSLIIYLISMIEDVAVFEILYTSIIIGAVISYILSCFVVIFVDFLKEKAKDI